MEIRGASRLRRCCHSLSGAGLDEQQWCLTQKQSRTLCQAKSTRHLFIASLYSVDLTDSFVVDVSVFGSVHTLILNRCDRIADVSALGAVRILYLSQCSLVRDVSALGRVHFLTIAFCPQIVDVSALGGVYSLTITGCHNISDISALGRVRQLGLNQCSKVVQLPVFHNAEYVGIALTNITDVSAIGRVSTLDISYTFISDVSRVVGLTRLYCTGCRFLDTSALTGVDVLW